MIYGRPAALWLGLVQAAINLAAFGFVAFTGNELSGQQAQFFIGLNALGGAIVALLANQAVNGSLLGSGE